MARAPTDRLLARISASILAASSGFALSFSSFSLMLSILRVVILGFSVEYSLDGETHAKQKTKVTLMSRGCQLRNNRANGNSSRPTKPQPSHPRNRKYRRIGSALRKIMIVRHVHLPLLQELKRSAPTIRTAILCYSWWLLLLS